MNKATKHTVMISEDAKIGKSSVLSLSIINLPSDILLLGISLILALLGIIITLVG
jgi:hypothetical protein